MVYKEAIYHDYPMGIFERNRSTSEADFRALQLRTFFLNIPSRPAAVYPR